jgi:hypothetical protein
MEKNEARFLPAITHIKRNLKWIKHLNASMEMIKLSEENTGIRLVTLE